MIGFKIYKDSKNRAVRLHVSRILMYAVLYGLALFFYFFLYGYVQYVILAVLTVLPVISVVSVFLLSRSCRVRLTVSEESVRRKETFSVGVLLSNPTLAASFDVKCRLRFENLFYQTGAELTAALPMVIHGESSMSVPLEATRNGTVQITAEELEISDFCGLISVLVSPEEKQSVQVLPESMELTEEERAGFFTGVSEDEEDILKGNDLADIGNIREYVPGDRMKDIHWKLSAKKEALLVKERVRRSENRLTVFLELTGSHEQMDEILKICYNLIQVCVKEGILVHLLWYGRTGEPAEESIGNREALNAAFLKVYTFGSCGERDGVGKAVRPVSGDGRKTVRTFVQVGLHEGKAGAVVIENEA